MIRNGSAAQVRAARRTKHIAAALIVMLPAVGGIALAAQPRTQALITIPPANLSRPATSPSAGVTAARALLPSTLQTVRDGEGAAGTVACGALAGKAASATTVLLALLGASDMLDEKPSPQLVLADQDDRNAQALFAATRNGTPALGIATVALDDGDGRVALLYDDATAFAASFPRLLQALTGRDVEIGVSDNSVSEPLTGAGREIDPGWQPVIAAVARVGENPLDPSLSQALDERLTAVTGRPWRIVPFSELK